MLRLASILNHSASRYLLAGGLSFLVDIGLLALFREVLNWPLWLATTTAFLGSFVFNYTVQRTFSFGAEAAHGPALLKYASLVATNTVAVVAIVAVVDLTAAGWLTGKVISTAATTIWNYFLFRHWVFAKPRWNDNPIAS